MSMNDELSDLLSTVAVREARWSVVTFSGTGMSRAYGDHIGCFIVLTGATNLRAGTSQVRIEKGDVIVSIGFPLVTLGNPHVDSPDAAAAAAADVLSWVRLGNDETEALLVEGELVLDDARLGFVRQDEPVLLVIKSFDDNVPVWVGALQSSAALRNILSGPGAAAISRRLGEICLIQALRADAIRIGQIPVLETRADPRISSAIRLVNAHPEKPWTVAALAVEVGMSRSEFAQHFADVVGGAPIHYLSRIRMALACDLLKLNRLPIAGVAARTGYSSDISFSRSFKRHYGLTPSEFRTFHRRREADAHILPLGSHPAFLFDP